MKKSLIAIFLTFITLLTFSGCSGDKNGASSQSSSGKAESSVASKANSSSSKSPVSTTDNPFDQSFTEFITNLKIVFSGNTTVSGILAENPIESAGDGETRYIYDIGNTGVRFYFTEDIQTGKLTGAVLVGDLTKLDEEQGALVADTVGMLILAFEPDSAKFDSITSGLGLDGSSSSTLNTSAGTYASYSLTALVGSILLEVEAK